MIVQLKTIKNEKFSLEIDPTATILQLKEKVEEIKGINKAQIKLIFKGVITVNEKLLSDYNVKENDFFVMMIIKAQQTQVQKQPVQQQEVKPPEQVIEQMVKPTVSSNIQPTSDQEGFGLTFVKGQQYEEAINNIQQMGFERAQIEKAMALSYNNPDRAIDFLINGFPEVDENLIKLAQEEDLNELINNQLSEQINLLNNEEEDGEEEQQDGEQGEENIEEQNDSINNAHIANTENSNINPSNSEMQIEQSFGQVAAENQEARENNEELNQQRSGQLDFLRDNSLFQQLKIVLRNNPSLLPSVISQLTALNPTISQIIIQNQQEFMQLLQEDEQANQQNNISNDSNSLSNNSNEPHQNFNMSIEEEQFNEREYRANDQDEEAIKRLCSLGFERNLVIEAYLNCLKDENTTANYLFDSLQNQEQEL